MEKFRPWHEHAKLSLEKKRLKTTVLSEKEKKHSLLMFRKICQASGVLPTLRIDLYAGDQLQRTCNPYVIFSVEGGSIDDEDGRFSPIFFSLFFILNPFLPFLFISPNLRGITTPCRLLRSIF